MKRQKIVAGNWKMNLDYSEARALATELSGVKVPKGTTVILGCPSVYLDVVRALTERNPRVTVAAQNGHQESKGAYTGETSHTMLSSMGIEYVILGHSERRAYNNETNTLLKKKVDCMIQNGMKIIFCCGEPLKIRKKKQQAKFVETQLKQSLLHLSKEEMSQVTIAYEPIWAIGTGETASPAQAQAMHKHIRSLLKAKYGSGTAASTPILYGGSVKPSNAKELFSKKDVDGGLVGGASLKAASFKSIIASV